MFSDASLCRSCRCPSVVDLCWASLLSGCWRSPDLPPCHRSLRSVTPSRLSIQPVAALLLAVKTDLTLLANRTTVPSWLAIFTLTVDAEALKPNVPPHLTPRSSPVIRSHQTKPLIDIYPMPFLVFRRSFLPAHQSHITYLAYPHGSRCLPP